MPKGRERRRQDHFPSLAEQEQLRASARTLAEHIVARDLEQLAPATWYALDERDPRGAPSGDPALDERLHWTAQTARSLAADELARRYLAETGLEAVAAWDAYRIAERWSGWDFDPRRLTEEQHAAYQHAGRRLTLIAAAGAIAGGTADAVPWREEFFATFAPDEVASLLETARAARPEADHEALRDHPLYVAALAEYDATLEHGRMTPEEVDAELESTLSANGLRQPSLAEWFRAHAGPPLSVGEIAMSVQQIRVEEDRRRLTEAERQATEERTRRAEAEQELARTKEQLRELQRNTLVPSALHGGWRRRDLPRRRDDLERGVLRPDGMSVSEATKLLDVAARQVNAREFADLSVPQIRTLVALCALLTDAGTRTEDGGEVFPRILTFTARQLYDQADVNSRQPKLCRDIMHAVVDLADLRVFLELTGRDSETRQKLVAFHEGAMFELTPQFKDDDPSLFDQWAAWRKAKRRDPKAAGPWAGPLPARYTVTFHDFIRQGWSPLVISREVLGRLERGARKVRGPKGRLTPLDWALFLELTFTRQDLQLEVFREPGAPEVHTFRCHVKRNDFLRDYLGAEMRKNPARARKSYHDSAEVLRAGGVTLAHELDVQTSKGQRDVYLPNPACLPGIGPRAERALARQEKQAADGEASSERGKGRRRRHAKGKK